MDSNSIKIECLNNLKELDIVMTHEGKVLWILKNEFTGKLQTFLPDLWGMDELDSYFNDFTFGKTLTYKQYKTKDCRQKSIEKVCRPRSLWHALHLMHQYEAALRTGDEEDIKHSLEKFKWMNVRDKWGKIKEQ